jgi:hypothetical protein
MVLDRVGGISRRLLDRVGGISLSRRLLDRVGGISRRLLAARVTRDG